MFFGIKTGSLNLFYYVKHLGCFVVGTVVMNTSCFSCKVLVKHRLRHILYEVFATLMDKAVCECSLMCYCVLTAHFSNGICLVCVIPRNK